MRPLVRSKSVGTKVSELQFAHLQQHATAQSLTLSEWARGVLLSASESNADSALTVILAELIATRTVLINLNFAIASSEPITAESLRSLLAKADSSKMQRAQLLLSAARTPQDISTHNAEKEADYEG